jgi:hypothetical protein
MPNKKSPARKIVERITLDNGVEQVISVSLDSEANNLRSRATEDEAGDSNKKRSKAPAVGKKQDGKQSPLYLHSNRLCGCYLESARVLTPLKEERDLYGSQGKPGTTDAEKQKNWLLINYCIYQPFLDGWDFTPDVGMGSTRGEIFTPRFIVDHMISDVGILPERMVYNFDYKSYKKKFEDKQNELRGYAGARVFEPAVGTGNYISSILWHKLEVAHELTGYKPYKRNGKTYYSKSIEQLARYQAYTLVALGSIYFNDIDPGNLQTTKWRILRDSEISNPANIEFWVEHIKQNLSQELERTQVKWLKSYVQESIQTASNNWASKDRDRGVLDVLYEKHTGEHAPDWLRAAWRRVLDANAQLFNGIKDEDTIEEGFVVPSNQKVIWTYWSFVYELSPLNEVEIQELAYRSNRKIEEILELGLDKALENVAGLRTAIPLLRQMLVGEREEVYSELSAMFEVLREARKTEAARNSIKLDSESGVPVFSVNAVPNSKNKAKRKRNQNLPEEPGLFNLVVESSGQDITAEDYSLDEDSLFNSASKEVQKQLRQLRLRLSKINTRLEECPKVSSLPDIVFYQKY